MSWVRRIPQHVVAEIDAALRAGLSDWSRALLGEPNPALSSRSDLRWGKNGSRSLKITGGSAGVGADFEAGVTHDPIGFIAHVRSCSWRDAVVWAAGWAGIPIEGVAAERSDPAEVAKRSEALRLERARREAESAVETAKREEGARRWWSRSVPLAGTPGERYLASRGIHSPVGGWPDMVGWVAHSTISMRQGDTEYASAGSLIVAAQDADGAVRAVQRVALDAEGKNVRDAAGHKLKPSRGSLRDAGAVVRLPGDPAGPLLLAEGPETGLSVWVATGHEVWIALGSVSHHRPPAGRRVVACRDDDAVGSPADLAFGKALEAWQRDGANVVVALPWPERRQDKSDFNDVLEAGGAAAVRARIDAALFPHGKPPARFPVEQARAELSSGVDEFFASAAGFNRQVEAIEKNVLPRHVEAARALMSNAAAEWDRAREAVGVAQAALHAAEAAGAADGGTGVEAARADLRAARTRRAAAKAAMTDGEQREVERLRRRAVKDAADEARRIAGAAPVHAMRVDVGGGKSVAARLGAARLLRQMREAGDGRSAAIFVPTVSLGDEQALAFNELPDAKAAGLQARVWRGRERPDPAAPGFDDSAIPLDRKVRMCRDLEAVRDAEEVYADPQTAVCERRRRGEEVQRCKHFESCGYQAQRRASADVWIIAHPMLFAAKPEAVGDVAFIIVDEGFSQSGLIGVGENPILLSIESLRHDTEVIADPIGSQRLDSLRMLVANAVATAEPGWLLRDAILATGIEPEGAAEARRLEWARKVEVSIYPGMPPDDRRAAVEAARCNRSIGTFATMWRALEALVRPDGPDRSGWVSIEVTNGTSGRVSALRLKGRKDIGGGWAGVPALLIDATLQPEMVRPFFPNVCITRDVKIVTPHQHITQIVDRTYSKRYFKRVKSAIRDLHAIVCREASAVTGRVLVVAQKEIKDKVEKLGMLPPNVELAHHNAVAGIDRWRDVDAMIVVGRTSPPSTGVELLAEALTGAAVERVGVTRDAAGPNVVFGYPKADAAREMAGGEMVAAQSDRHPDAAAEAFRWRICEGELLQIIGRCRGTNRTSDKPVNVLLLTNVVLPLPIARLVSADDVKPSLFDLQMSVGGVAFSNPADAAVAYDGVIWDSVAAARRAYLREDAHSLRHSPYILSMGFVVEKAGSAACSPVSPIRVTYQRAGRGQRECVAFVRPDLADSAASLVAEKLGGPLARCEVVTEDLARMEPVPPCVPDAPQCAPVDPADYGIPAPEFGGIHWPEQVFRISGRSGASRLFAMKWPPLPPVLEVAPLPPPKPSQRRVVADDFDPNAPVSTEAMLRGLLAGAAAPYQTH